MDPDAALASLREQAEDLMAGSYPYDPDLMDVADFVEVFRALDEWLSKGGFKPKDWEQPGWWADLTEEQAKRFSDLIDSRVRLLGQSYARAHTACTVLISEENRAYVLGKTKERP